MKIHKRVVAGIMAVCVMGGVTVFNGNVLPAPVLTASAEEYTYENLTYDFLKDGTIEITGCDKFVTDVVIPEEIDGVPVTSIGEYAFYCKKLISITIPDGVKSIGMGAFWYCEKLESITIPESVTDIGVLAFRDTAWLEEKSEENPFVIVNNLLIDGHKCSGDVVIPDGVTAIIGHTFDDCINLKSVKIPDSVKNIGYGAFLRCENLSSIDIPDSVEYIDTSAFYGTSWLSEKRKDNPLVIVNGILIDGKTCSGDVVIPDGVIYIGGYAFENCLNLTEITLPESVISIGDSAFWNCENLKSINIPDNVLSIDCYAFCYCSNLESITILNPECEIYDYDYTISNEMNHDYYLDTFEYYFNGTIYGYENSTAQAYAEKHGYKFESLGKAPEKTGDMNGDKEFNISDVLTLQKYLLGGSNTEITDWKQADLNSDGVLDVFDLVLMRKKLIEK